MRSNGKFSRCVFLSLVGLSLFSCDNSERLNEAKINMGFTDNYYREILNDSKKQIFHQFSDVNDFNSFFHDENKIELHDQNTLKDYNSEFFMNNSVALLIMIDTSSNVLDQVTFDKDSLCVNYFFTLYNPSKADIGIRPLIHVVPTTQKIDYKVDTKIKSLE